MPHGQSLRSFCLSNKVPYNIFSKWYRDTRRKIEAVLVDDRPSESSAEESELPIQAASRYSSPKVEKASLEDDVSGNAVRIWVGLHMSNGVVFVEEEFKLSGTTWHDSEIGEAMLNLNVLTAYVQDGVFPIDNNAVE